MFTNSLIHYYIKNQETSLRIGEEIKFRGNEVFCPMCEVWHINNSECQRND